MEPHKVNKKKGIKENKFGNIIGGKIKFRDIEEILQRTVTSSGNGAHINIPKKHIGKEVQITVWVKEEDSKG